MNLLGKGLVFLAREFVQASAQSAGAKIGEALGHLIGKRIDPTWNPDAPSVEVVEVVERDDAEPNRLA